MRQAGSALVLVTGAAVLGLVVLNPALATSLLKTLGDLLTNGFAVARGGKPVAT